MLPLRELHRFFSIKVQSGLYLLDKGIEESPAWYVHDIVVKAFLGISFGIWYLRERGKDTDFAKYIGVFTLFFTLDFVLYLLTHSHAGIWYFVMVYIPVIIYAIKLIKKRK